MSILNFRKQRQYTKNKSGQYDLVSNWTSAETVYDRDGHCVMERLDNALLPMVDGTDNGIYLEDSVTLKVGESVTLQSLVIPSNASVDWTVDNTQDVSISNGVVTAIDNHVGRATVTARINGTQTMAQCEIYITD